MDRRVDSRSGALQPLVAKEAAALSCVSILLHLTSKELSQCQSARARICPSAATAFDAVVTTLYTPSRGRALPVYILEMLAINLKRLLRRSVARQAVGTANGRCHRLSTQPQYSNSESSNESMFFIQRKANLLVALGLISGVSLFVAGSREDNVFAKSLSHSALTPFEQIALDDEPDQSPTDELVDRIVKELTNPSVRYFVTITGQEGTGKSKAVRKAVRRAQQSGAAGLVYHRADGHSDSYATLSRLAAAGRKFTSQYHKPAVVILDGVERVAMHQPEVFDAWIHAAKDYADEGCLRIVFVLPVESQAFKELRGRSEWSRCWSCITVRDLPDTAAITYLTQRGMNGEQAVQVVSHLTGGRLWLLRRFQHLTGSVDEQQQILHRHIHSVLRRIGVEPTHEVFKHILGSTTLAAKNGTGSASQWTPFGHCRPKEIWELIPPAQLKALEESQILVQHEDYSYSFYSRVEETFFRAVLRGATSTVRERC